MNHLLPQDTRFETKKLFVFDLDGTVADTSEGILNSHRHAHIAMGRPVPSDEILYGVIGGPLLDTYRTVFNFSEKDAVEAVRIYREWYAINGIHQARLYPGMKDLLVKINEQGLIVGMATLKAEKFAVTMMEELGIRPLFQFIYGMNESDTLTKAGLINECISSAGVSPEETCMIGDSIHDYNGAQISNVSFIGVSYGFGLHENKGYDFPLYDSPLEITEKLRL